MSGLIVFGLALALAAIVLGGLLIWKNALLNEKEE